jgi:transposase
VFLDESGAKTNLTRLRGRAQRGKRVYASCPHGHWRTTTMIGALRVEGPGASITIAGPTDTAIFEAYIREALCPTLRRGDVVIMDNLSPHKGAPALAQIAQAGAEVRFLPAYSPDLNPIELMWSKVKTGLRTAEARTQPKLLKAIASSFETITGQDARNWFAHCGYSFI